MRPFWYRFTNVVRTAREGPGSSVKRSRVQSQDTPSRWCCLEIAPRQRPTHSHTRRSNCSRPRSWRVIPSSCRLLSTTHWVEMPAWSTPGSHNVGSPIMRCQRTMISSIVAVRACPICNSPVTFGGGMMITNGFLARSILGVKYPFPIQKAYQRSSALPGSYALGISDMVTNHPVFMITWRWWRLCWDENERRCLSFFTTLSHSVIASPDNRRDVAISPNVCLTTFAEIASSPLRKLAPRKDRANLGTELHSSS